MSDIQLNPNTIAIVDFFNNNFEEQYQFKRRPDAPYRKELTNIIPMLIRLLDSDDPKQINEALEFIKKLYKNGNECFTKDKAILCLKNRKKQIEQKIKKDFTLNPVKRWKRNMYIKNMRPDYKVELKNVIQLNVTEMKNYSLIEKMFYLNENEHDFNEITKNMLVNLILSDIKLCNKECFTQEKDGFLPIHIAIILNNEIIINEILNKNEIKTTINSSSSNSDFNTYTPLILAIENRNVEVVKKLIELGANVNQTFEYDGIIQTPLGVLTSYTYTFFPEKEKEKIREIKNLLIKKNASEHASQGGSSRQYISKKQISKKRISKKQISKKRTMKKRISKKRSMKKQIMKKQSNR